MPRRNWDDLNPEQRAKLERDGISRSEWNAGSSRLPIPSPDDDPPDDDDDDSDTPEDLEEAVANPDEFRDYWRGRTSERLSFTDKERLADSVQRHLERELGDEPKFNHHSIAERVEKSGTGRLRLLGAMNADQLKQMARWAAEQVKAGDYSFAWLLYH